MSIKGTATLQTILIGIASVGAANAAEILVNSNISSSTTWTANNSYNLQQQIYVLPGATLTIEAGTLIASDTNLGGSLAVCKGAKIIANGTQAKPIIFTSKADVATWTGGNPKTGVWREACNEWGNLTIMGAAYISDDRVAGNTPAPSPSNVGEMEGLVADFPGDTKVLYGGGDDDDDSGSLHYVSFRYGGKVIALANELNGLSMGGIGRETDVDHIDIMNNVDDGIETWGGTVNYKYINVWNVGDDSFDTDQGWRGKAQFGLLVQGYSIDAARGSGVGDNCFEMDGAEDSDWQPVSTNVVYNFTCIGQPLSGRGGTAWRDNNRTQYRNCIFMDLGLELVRFDNSDNEHGHHGYGFNGTLSWADTWTTAFNSYSPVNPFADGPANHYKAQVDGKLAEIKDSVFFRNQFVDAYTEATARGVFDPANNNVLIPGFDDVDSPVTTLTRGGPVTRGGFILLPVTFLDPRPQNEALNSVAFAPKDGFFSSSRYRGAMTPDLNWLCGWTASQAFGFTPTDCQWNDEGFALKGTNGDPLLTGIGSLTPGQNVTLKLRDARTSVTTNLIIGLAEVDLPFFGGTLVPAPNIFVLGLPTGGAGGISLTGAWPAGIPSGFTIYFQHWITPDPNGSPTGFAASNGLSATQP
ncbi:MAG: hypothetical protein U1E76_21700 [Planctomycetota bacterium]